MKPIKKMTIGICSGLIIVIAVSVSILMLFQHINSSRDVERIRIALNWGGLHELPVNIQDLNVRTRGSMFSRSIIVEFKSNKTEIDRWINLSKRLKGNKPENMGRNTFRYKIEPGEEGSFGGTVDIDYNKLKVVILMSWS